MDLHLQYLTDEHGAKTAVQIPLPEWMQFLEEYTHVKQYAALKSGLAEAFQDVREIETGNVAYMTLQEFLHES